MAVEDAILLSRTCKKFIWYTDVMNFVRKKFFRTAYLPAIMLNWCGDSVPVSVEGEDKVTALKYEM